MPKNKRGEESSKQRIPPYGLLSLNNKGGKEMFETVLVVFAILDIGWMLGAISLWVAQQYIEKKK